MHLTNYSVNKKAENYIKNDGQESEELSSKLTFQQLRDEYQRMGIDSESVFKSIREVIIKSLVSVESEITFQMLGRNQGECFNILGYDVMLDSKLKPWLLEVNVEPSFASSSLYDKQVKTKLVSDTMHLVGFNIFNRKKAAQEAQQI